MARSDRDNVLGGDLVHLKHSDFDVADGYPDIRGWDVVSRDGQKLGKVDDLVVSTTEMRVLYVDVDVDRSLRDTIAAGSRSEGGASVERGHALVPIGTAQLDDADDRVIVPSLGGADLPAYPRYAREQGITPEYESSLRERHGAGGAGLAAAAGAGTARDYDHDDYDQDRLFAASRGRKGARPGAAEGEQRLTLSEEELSVGKRQVSAGEVELQKRVETEHVRESVPVTREEVTIERRPLAAGADVNADIGEDEIRIPLMAEEVVVEKRMVPKEQVLVRKRAVTENRTVEADLRREHLDESGLRGTAAATSGAAGLSGAADRASDSGLLDRLKDKLDDVKDRVDGDPASRPGPDAADRRI